VKKSPDSVGILSIAFLLAKNRRDGIIDLFNSIDFTDDIGQRNRADDLRHRNV
jgi:hypothetical protein